VIGSVEAPGEPAAFGREEVLGILPLARLGPQPGEAVACQEDIRAFKEKHRLLRNIVPAISTGGTQLFDRSRDAGRIASRFNYSPRNNSH